MKEPKSYLLTLVTVFLILIVGMMLSIAIYLYFLNKPKTVSVQPVKQEAPVKQDAVKKAHIQEINKNDSVPNNSSSSLEKLRTEITDLLSDSSIAVTVEADKKKMDEIKTLVNQLKNKNKNAREENQALQKKLQELKQNIQKSETINKNNPKDASQQKKLNSSYWQIENVQIKAISSADLLNKETNNADQTDKLIGSFLLANDGAKETTVEIIVVVIQPDGSVLQTSDWETGIFYKSSGKQIYTKKLRVNIGDREIKKIELSLQAEKFLPGKYTIEFYYGGSIIRAVTKILS